MEKLVKTIINSDKFQELKDILPSVYHLTKLLAKDVEYGSVSPELEGRVKKHFQYVWKYLNLPENISLTGPETAFMKDMQKNMKAVKSTMNDLRRTNMFGESKTMKISKKQLNKLVESIVAEMCDEELNENIDDSSALEMVLGAAKTRMPSALKAAMEQLANEQPHAYKSLFKIARTAIENPINKNVWAKVAEKAMKLQGLNESELSPDPEWESIQGAPMGQHYPGTFERDGSRPDLKEQQQQVADSDWFKKVMKTKAYMAKVQEQLEELDRLSGQFNINQVQGLKKVAERADQLQRVLDSIKFWGV